MKELTKEQIEKIFINFADESVNDELHLSLYAFKEALNEAINYTRCCTELKDKEAITFDEWKKENVVEENVCNEYLYKYGGWFDADDLLSMYKKDISL